MFSFYDFRKVDPKYSKNKRFFVFSLITDHHITQLKDSKDVSKLNQILEDIFEAYILELSNNNESFDVEYQIQIFKDLQINCFDYAISKKFSDEKISCLMQLTYEIFANSMKMILPFNKSFDLFKEFLLRHSLFRPPHSINIFSLEEIKDILDYFQNGFFRHYSLYLKAFTPSIDYEIITFHSFKSRFPHVIDLDEGMPMNKDHFDVLDAYNKDKEIKLTKQELDDIMSGNSVFNIPEWKKEILIKNHFEKLKKEKIERVLQKELEKLNEKMAEKIRLQDEEFEQKAAGKKK